jgi:NAD(P)H-quinone oxidoreductase subunit N
MCLWKVDLKGVIGDGCGQRVIPACASRAKGLGDLAAYLTGVHGVRPPHLGKKDIRVYYLPPVVGYQLEHLPPKSKGLVLWIIEGSVLSRQEVEYLTTLPKQEPRVKIVVEIGGDRYFRWTPLKDTLPALVSARDSLVTINSV